MDASRMLAALSAATGRLGALAARALGRGGGAPAEEADGLLDIARLDEDEALFLVRVMVAAAAAEGVATADERERIVAAMREAGLDPQDAAWLETELRWPMDVEEIAERVATPEAAARAYAAARLAIDPDTMQEREFLRMLAERMDLLPEETARIEAAAEARR